MESIEINVQKDTAEKWRKASSETRERIERKIQIELAKDQNGDSKDRFVKFLYDLGQRMEERGLTEEKLKDILANE